MSARLTVGVALVLAAVAAGWEPVPGRTVREWEVPQAPIVVERPPRVFREVTDVYEITPRPRVEVLDLGGRVEVPRRVEVGAVEVLPRPRVEVLDRAAVEIPRRVEVLARPTVVDVRERRGCFGRTRTVVRIRN